MRKVDHAGLIRYALDNLTDNFNEKVINVRSVLQACNKIIFPLRLSYGLFL